MNQTSQARASSRILILALSVVTSLLWSVNALACATCGCTLSTDAAMGYSAETGWRINLEYDFIDQDQLRSGANAISAGQVARINDAGGNQEVEHQTINRYTTLGLTYTPTPDWSVSLLVPYVNRSHDTYGNATSSEINQGNLSAATASGIGDMKVLLDWQGILPTHNLGLQAGLKLPTGRYGGANAVTGALVGRDPVVFSSGPAAGGALDTSLNPGTGSTDVIVGAYYYQPVSQNFDAFVNGQFQAAVSEKLDQTNADFRPGNVETLSFGLRYEENPALVAPGADQFESQEFRSGRARRHHRYRRHRPVRQSGCNGCSLSRLELLMVFCRFRPTRACSTIRSSRAGRRLSE